MENSEEKKDHFFVVKEQPDRLDKILVEHYKKDFSRSYLQKLIRENKVRVNDAFAQKRMQLKKGDRVEIFFPSLPDVSFQPESIALDIIYEDEYFLAINKPKQMVVHPGAGHHSNTFANALFYHCKDNPHFKDLLINDEKNVQRPGIVHRLDKDTSGLLIAAKTLDAHKRFVELFHQRKMKKNYLAICIGNPKIRKIDLPIGRSQKNRKKFCVNKETGKEATTFVSTLAVKDKISFVQLLMQTGRTHQIRVHLQHIGCPILGDSVYGNAQLNKRYEAESQLLHAFSLSFCHPFYKKEMVLHAFPSSDFMEWVEKIADCKPQKISDLREFLCDF